MGERKKERERNINAWLPPACPPLGTWPETQGCALIGNQTCDLWVAGCYSIYCATPARAYETIFIIEVAVFLIIEKSEILWEQKIKIIHNHITRDNHCTIY